MRQSIAHLATPWEWESRLLAMLLVLGLVAVTIGGIVLGLLAGNLIVALLNAVIGFALFGRPALKIARRRYVERRPG